MANLGFKEDLLNEFKSDRNYLHDNEIIDAVVAFANTDGGDLYLGVEDDGEITGLHKDHRDITRLAAFIANKTVPPVSVRVEYFEGDYIKISVPKRTTIVASASGKMQRRRLKADGTPENVPMYPYEISSRLSSLSLLDYTAQPVLDGKYSDLDSVERQRLRNIIRAYRGDIALLELSDEELDKALQFVTTLNGELVPTFCGIIMIGTEEAVKRYMPTAESAIQIFAGTDIKINQSLKLPALAAIENITSYFNAYNLSEEMEIGLYRMTIPSYDPRAFREALVNAFCHRDYSMLGRVRVQINDEGMTISNPGGFIEGITADNLLDAEPHGRNPVLADAMKRIGLAERTGRGIDRIYEGSLMYGRMLPDYSQTTATTVKLFIPKGPVDREFIRLVSEEQARLGRPLPIYSLLILNVLKQRGKLSLCDIAEELNIAEKRVKLSVEPLVNSGIVESIGSGRGRYYMLGAKYYNAAQKSSVYVRQKGIELIRYEELVMQLAKTKGTVCRSDVEELLHIGNAQAYRVLKKLATDGKLKLVGSGAGAKYIIYK
ncbi:MAG: ATP-binding protein [Candidatus Coproplasma sp.]